MVGCFGLNGPLRQYFSPNLPERGRKKRNDKREKNVQTTPPAPTASTEGPCPTLIQISRTPRHWKFVQHHHTTRPPPVLREVPAVLALGGGASFCPLTGHCSLAVNTGIDSPALAASDTLSSVPHLLQRKDSPAGAGQSFLPFFLQPHPLFSPIMVVTKMPSLETFKSNLTINPT